MTQPRTGESPTTGPPSGKLLEREQELARLRDALEAARGGRGGTLVVDGPAGIGKTALLRRTRRLAREASMTVLSSRGRELEREFPFGVARQLFEPELRAADPARRATLLLGAAQLAQPLVTGGAATAAAGLGEGDPGFGLVHGLYWLAANLTEERPVLVLVDDAHWVDAQTLRFLAYLGSRSPDLPLLVLLAVRTGESDDPRLAELESDPATTTVAPHALSPGAVQEIVGAELGDGETAPDTGFCAACAELTGGNPFLLGELIAELRNEQVRPVDDAITHIERVRPASVSRAVVLRLLRLGRDAQRLAHAVALLEKAELRDAAALADLEPAAARGAADLLCATRILATPARTERDGAPALVFVHPLLRHAVYESVPPSARADGHRRAALLLARRGVIGSPLAAHLLRSEAAGDPAIVELCRAVAAETLGGGEPETALRLYRRALSEPATEEVRAVVLGELGEAAALARDPAAEEHLSAALEGSLPPEIRARLVPTLAQWLVWNGRTSEAHALVTRTLAQFGESAPIALRAGLETLRTGIGSLSREHIAEVEARLDEVHALAVTAGEAGAGLLIAEGCVRAQRGDWNGNWRVLIAQGLGDGRFIATHTGSSPIIDYAAVCFVLGDEPERARALLDAVRADAIARGSIRAYLNVINWTAVLAARLGDYAQAEEDARTALELAIRHQVLWTVLWASATLGRALLATGRLEEAEAVFEQAPLAAARGSSPWLHVVMIRSRLRIEQGRTEEAIADARGLGELTIIDNPSYVPWRSVLAQALGPGEEAAALADAELARARRLGQPRGIGGALRAVAAAGAHADSVAVLHEAVEVLRRSPARLELAQALCDLGSAQRRAGQRMAAREPLREAVELARACGAGPLVTRARDELAASGARPRRDRWAGPEALTPSERRVAELAAAGRTNREIAQALFVTTKTVGTHLGHVYGKLGLQGAEAREQLASALRAVIDLPDGA